jgi:hypothetical protein
MGLLYYGQNFLIYPSAFPAGARESAYLLPFPRDILALPPCSDYYMRPAPFLGGIPHQYQTFLSRPIFPSLTPTSSSRLQTTSR